jgi:uncharacterized membrane protein
LGCDWVLYVNQFFKDVFIEFWFFTCENNNYNHAWGGQYSLYVWGTLCIILLMGIILLIYKCNECQTILSFVDRY